MTLTAEPVTLAQVWCDRDAEPAIHGHAGVPYYDAETQTGRCLSCGGDPYHDFVAYCAKHDPRPLTHDRTTTGRQLPPWETPVARAAMGYAPRRVPDAITDPWLRAQFAQATGAIDDRKGE